jgi:hypothetical protein
MSTAPWGRAGDAYFYPDCLALAVQYCSGPLFLLLRGVRREHAHEDCKRAETETIFYRIPRRPKLVEGLAKGGPQYSSMFSSGDCAIKLRGSTHTFAARPDSCRSMQSSESPGPLLPLSPGCFLSSSDVSVSFPGCSLYQEREPSCSRAAVSKQGVDYGVLFGGGHWPGIFC